MILLKFLVLTEFSGQKIHPKLINMFLKATVSSLRLIKSAMFGATFKLVTRVGLP